MKNDNRHKNYEILNLIGYGLAKFDNQFIEQFGFASKTDFYKFCVSIKIADKVGVVKNRMDLFDPFFPNHRKGWWQKGDAYIHRKLLIDNLFGNENVEEYVNIVKLYFKNEFSTNNFDIYVKPIVISRFQKLQETGLEAELFFMNNYMNIPKFKESLLEDARLFGDGYDFQIKTKDSYFLVEIKGIREKKGKFRFTENEYQKAVKYKDRYVVIIILNLNYLPSFVMIENPIENLTFETKVLKSKIYKEYHVNELIKLNGER